MAWHAAPRLSVNLPWRNIKARDADHWLWGPRCELILHNELDGVHVYLSPKAERIWRDITRQLVTRLFVVIGDPSGDPYATYKEPRYDTDPRRYGLQLLTQPVSDEEFDREYRQKLRAFPNREDAILCACHCNLDNLMCPVYDRVGDEWILNQDETSRVLDEII